MEGYYRFHKPAWPQLTKKNGTPSDEQAKAYIAMLGATAGLKGDIAPASLFDFSLGAEAAKEMAVKK